MLANHQGADAPPPTHRVFPKAFRGNLDSDGRISRLPSKYSKRIALCETLLNYVKIEVDYTEKQINEIFFEFVDDFAFVRRTLVDLGHLERDRYGAVYRRLK